MTNMEIKYTSEYLRTLTFQQLTELEKETRAVILEMNTQAAQEGHGRIRNTKAPHVYNTCRKLIARIQTAVNEKRLN